jgi:ketosteroid isomerase-like protein
MNRTLDRESRAAADQARRPPEQRILSMTPDGHSGDSVKSVVRRRVEAMALAICDKDLDQLMTFYAHDVEVFDVRFSINLLGAAAYRNNFEHWFESFEGPIGFEHHNLRIKVDEDVAFCHYLALVTGARPGGRTSGYWVRGTTCFERRDGEWLVTHEHISTPAQ